MTVKAGQIYVRREPQGGPFDKVRVVGPSPLGQGEWTVAPVDPFSGDTDARQVVSTSATEESLLAAYVYDSQHTPPLVELGINAVEAWRGI